MMSSKHTDDPEPLSSRGKSIITKSLNIGVKKIKEPNIDILEKNIVVLKGLGPFRESNGMWMNEGLSLSVNSI